MDLTTLARINGWSADFTRWARENYGDEPDAAQADLATVARDLAAQDAMVEFMDGAE